MQDNLNLLLGAMYYIVAYEDRMIGTCDCYALYGYDY